MTKIVLVGNPNVGKTTLFNYLTATDQSTGNWPGVTVEKNTGQFTYQGNSCEVVDLPGLFSLETSEKDTQIDQSIARDYLTREDFDIVINVVDASKLTSNLFLTTQLRENKYPTIVVLTMMDVTQARGINVNVSSLSSALECPVLAINAKQKQGFRQLVELIPQINVDPLPKCASINTRYQFIDNLILEVVSRTKQSPRNLTDVIDSVVLNRYLAIPIFLIVMYGMFFFAINVGSAFIDFFDITLNILVVEAPRTALTAINCPDIVTTIIADGVGGGIQLVGTFVPVIGCLFLYLCAIEDSGYMNRITFILDRPMQKIGLPGKALIPLVIGFGCNVPAVMATRSMDNRTDRILTAIMAPFMSCSARLTVYVLFAVAFFPSNQQNIVFLLYLIGILVAIGSVWLVKKHILETSETSFPQTLPTYHIPSPKAILSKTYRRLKGFVIRAGTAIVLVVVALNFVNSIGTDGSVGNEDTEKSVLSAIGKTITPVFSPMGVTHDNWPAAVAIFTGFFAKEVVVGTLDALYTPTTEDSGNFDYGESFQAALRSIPDGLLTIGDAFLNPFGVFVDSTQSTVQMSEEVGVSLTTVQAMQSGFTGKLAAFSYLIFVLLYIPCVATIGVIYKECGGFWATFSVVWSVALAYALAVFCYQTGIILDQPTQALITIGIVAVSMFVLFRLLVFFGKRSEISVNRRIAVVETH
ncbi:MAG: ferrous iron transport protein B [Gammaproteobacteria bacterium]|nr:ferrous iron transport protein B [Gammaproteobacteria bacterium]MYF53761.1 ferrous iron transport protein B [Gammaproteobacteria bacterium]MYK42512.1 ferrous iron transport protein B [Gammaproteobacteria bacterium]